MSTDSALPRFELDGERFVRPDFAGLGLANVAPTVLRLLSPAAAEGLELPALDTRVLPEALTRDVTTIVLVVADGLGHRQLEREIAAGNAPNLGELLTRARSGDECVAYAPITSVFPTTTVAALGSVNSGVPPVSHGLLGYTVYLPEFDTVAEMIRWGPLNRRISFADAEYGQSPESFFWAKTTYARLRAAGMERVFAVNPSLFSGTALTRMLHQQARYAGYVSTSSLTPLVSRIVAESDSEPTYIYAYWPTVDTIAHIVGPLTPEHGSEVASFDFQFGRLLRSLPARGRTLVMLTADHGHVAVDPKDAIQMSSHPELIEMLRVAPAGERRVVYLHPKPGFVDAVLAYARERLRDIAPAVLRSEAIEMGMFGPAPLAERAVGRIGEVLLFPRGNVELVTPPEFGDGSPPREFRGLHGGLTPEEAVVPLLALRF